MNFNKLRLPVVLVSIFSSLPSFAYVIEIATCTTSDGKYQVSVINNEGIGKSRAPQLTGGVTDSNGDVLANYVLTYDSPRFRSMSFGTSTYVDTGTSGRMFSLTTGSTNRGPRLSVVLTDGSTIVDDKVSCQFY